jgi:peptidoglycan/LPS O-acetylase OafA/YrhL
MSKLDLDSPKRIGDKTYFPALTGLRAVAAYLVFLHHYNPMPSQSFWVFVVAQNYVGVSIFFVLSGFLIHYQYTHLSYGSSVWLWGVYIRNRCARILPIYFIILVPTLLLNVCSQKTVDAEILFLNLTLLKGYFEWHCFTGVPQSWSTTVEATFYAVAPLLFVGIRRFGVVVCLSILWTVACLMVFSGWFGSVRFILFYTFFGRAFEFICGIILATIWLNRRPMLPAWIARVGSVIVIACMGGMACTMYLNALTETTKIGLEFIAYNCLLPIGITGYIGSLLTQKSALTKLLSSPFFDRLGKSSYSFFMIHIGIIPKGLQKLMPGLSILDLFAFLLLLSYVLYRLIERPLYNHFRVHGEG